MTRRVNWELKHIPRGETGSAQRMLRAAFNMMRRADLSHNPETPPRQTLDRAAQEIRKAYPDSPLDFDPTFFGI